MLCPSGFVGYFIIRSLQYFFQTLSFPFSKKKKRKKSDLFIQDTIRVIGELRSFNGVVYCSSNNL